MEQPAMPSYNCTYKIQSILSLWKTQDAYKRVIYYIAKHSNFLAEKSVTFSFIKAWCVQMENKLMSVKSFSQSHKESLGYAQD